MGLLLPLIGGVLLIRRDAAEGWYRYTAEALPTAEDATIRTGFLAPAETAEARYTVLFRYFARGMRRYLSSQGERIHYPGMASSEGYAVNGLEGFARTAPLLAAWIYGGRGTVLSDPGGGSMDLVAMLRQGLLTGTNRGSPAYWGDINDYDQRIVEAADIARTVWLTRREIWDQLPPAAQRQIGDWLARAVPATVWDNNWHLFPVVVGLVLQNLGYPGVVVPEAHYAAFRLYHRGYGWFFDMPKGIDYYNAWGISYDLFWIAHLAPEFDAGFPGRAVASSASLVLHLLSPGGLPIMGRSICYRTAVPAPVMAQSLLDPAPLSPGLARRALDVVWRHFVEHGALRDGQLTQGYHASDPRFVERYTGAGSCHWGLRSLVLAFLHPPEASFWTAPAASLPVELADYDLDLPELGWRVSGRAATGEVAIEIPANPSAEQPIAGYSWLRRAAEQVLLRPLRPFNNRVQYEQRRYSTTTPFPLRPR